LIAFVFIVGTTVGMGAVGFHYTVTFEKARFAEHFKLLASYLASNSELGVLLGDEKMLSGLCENMLLIQSVQHVEIVDNKGGQIIQRSNRQSQSPLVYVEAAVYSRSMGATDSPFLIENSGAVTLGKVIIGYSLVGLQQLKQQLAYAFIFLSLLLALVPAILYWRLARAIRAPLQEVLDVAGQVSRGQMDVRADGGTLEETSTLACAFNEMLDALQQQRRQIKAANDLASQQRVLAEVGQFSLTVAHEIKNPLAIISGSLEILRKKKQQPPEVQAKMFSYIDEEIERINRLIEDFLLFARPQPTVLRPVAAADLFRKLVQRIKLLNTAVDVHQEEFDLSCCLAVECDLAQFERALFNVIRNAIEISSVPEKVQVTIACTPTHLEFKVRDDGPGVKANQVKKMFTPFFSTKAKGTGLGLAIVGDTIKVHRGIIRVKNNYNGGACFILSLPFINEPQKS